MPFEGGSLMDYAGKFKPGEVSEKWGSPDEWRANEPFEATLVLSGIERGRSAARFTWKDEQGREWPMFMADTYALMATVQGVQAGRATGKWLVIKRGANYGITPLTAWITEADRG